MSGNWIWFKLDWPLIGWLFGWIQLMKLNSKSEFEFSWINEIIPAKATQPANGLISFFFSWYLVDWRFDLFHCRLIEDIQSNWTEIKPIKLPPIITAFPIWNNKNIQQYYRIYSIDLPFLTPELMIYLPKFECITVIAIRYLH